MADWRDQSALDLANQVAAKVKQRTRPWRALIALALAVAAAGVSIWASQRLPRVLGPGHLADRVIWASTAAGFFLLAVMAVVGLAGKAREFLPPRASGHAAVVRYTIILIGGVATFLITLSLFKIPVGQLIVGGALTTIIIGIAAQQSLGNVFAGIVLLLSRPFAVGDPVLLRSGSLGGQLTGTVTEIGLTYVRLRTEDGVLYLPNSQVLAAGVGHAGPARQDGRRPATEAAPRAAAPPPGQAGAPPSAPAP